MQISFKLPGRPGSVKAGQQQSPSAKGRKRQRAGTAAERIPPRRGPPQAPRALAGSFEFATRDEGTCGRRTIDDDDYGDDTEALEVCPQQAFVMGPVSRFTAQYFDEDLSDDSSETESNDQGEPRNNRSDCCFCEGESRHCFDEIGVWAGSSCGAYWVDRGIVDGENINCKAREGLLRRARELGLGTRQRGSQATLEALAEGMKRLVNVRMKADQVKQARFEARETRDTKFISEVEYEFVRVTSRVGRTPSFLCLCDLLRERLGLPLAHVCSIFFPRRLLVAFVLRSDARLFRIFEGVFLFAGVHE